MLRSKTLVLVFYFSGLNIRVYSHPLHWLVTPNLTVTFLLNTNNMTVKENYSILNTVAGGYVEIHFGNDIQALSCDKGDNIQALSYGSGDNIQALSYGSGDNIQALSYGSGDDIQALSYGSGNNIQALSYGSSDNIQALSYGSGDNI